MKNPITELEDLSTQCDPVSMRVMDAPAFEKFFGEIYATIKLFKSRQHTAQEVERIVSISSRLLDEAVRHHQNEPASATEKSVMVYDEIVILLKDIIKIDLQITDSVYDQSRRIKLWLDAIKACGITPPGHSEPFYHSRFGGDDKKDAMGDEALLYAKTNISEFTQFVYSIALDQKFVPDPFWGQPQSSALSLFEKVRVLGSGISMLEGKSQAADA